MTTQVLHQEAVDLVSSDDPEEFVAMLTRHFSKSPDKYIFGCVQARDGLLVAFRYPGGVSAVQVWVAWVLDSSTHDLQSYTGRDKLGKALRAICRLHAKWSKSETDAAYRLGAYRSRT